MKNFLSAVLLALLAAGLFPAGAQAQGALKRPVTKATQKAQNDAQRQKQLNQRAWNSIPGEAKTHITFSWREPAKWNGGEGTAYLSNVCTAILCNYEEKNGLGTAHVAINAECVRAGMKGNHGYVEANLYLGAFGFEPDPSPGIRGDGLSYETELLRSNVNKILHFRKVTDAKDSKKVLGSPMYILYLPVTSGQKQLQSGLRALFPNKKSFVTAERAARALTVNRKPTSSVRFQEDY